jgi:coatomer subunit epsilon
MSAPDLLFAVRNNFYLGAYQHAISEASDLESLDEADKMERDIFVYRSYIELGSYEVGSSSLQGDVAR